MIPNKKTPVLSFIRLGALGDLVHAAASVQTVRRVCPDVSLIWLTRPAFFPLLAAIDEAIHPWAWPESTMGQYARLFCNTTLLTAAGVSSVVNAHPSLKTRMLTSLIQTKSLETSIYRKEKRLQHGVVIRNQPRMHAVENFYAPFKALTSLADRLPDQPDEPQLRLPARWEQEGLSFERPTIVILPGVGQKRPNRAWPVASILALMGRLLAETSLDICVLGGAEELPLLPHLQQACPESPRVTWAIGGLSLPGLLQTLGRAALVIGGDTGPLHVAAALGTPTLGLYAPTDVARTGPRGPQPEIIQTLTPPTALTCWPCERSRCDREDRSCMSQISVDRVFNSALTLLSLTEPVPQPSRRGHAS